jgi:hypothetical protein
MREGKGNPEPVLVIRIVASGVRGAVLVDVGFPRDCSNIDFVDARPSEATGAVPRRSFAACRSRSRAVHIEGFGAI